MKIKEALKLVDDKTYSQVLEYFVQNATNATKKLLVVSINPEIIMLAKHDYEYEKILKSADLALNDGAGVSFAARMLGKRLSGRIVGVDLVNKVVATIAEKPITVGFLGGKDNVAELTAERLKEKYPGLKVAFALEEPGSSSLKSDILFVAFGSPKQEKWIYKNMHRLDVKIAMGVGGSFDFISGKTRRAPSWMRKVGLEWLFRLFMQPWRLKRQFSLLVFTLLVIKEKISN